MNERKDNHLTGNKRPHEDNCQKGIIASPGGFTTRKKIIRKKEAKLVRLYAARNSNVHRLSFIQNPDQNLTEIAFLVADAYLIQEEIDRYKKSIEDDKFHEYITLLYEGIFSADNTE